MAVAKVILNGSTLIDTTSVTVQPSTLFSGNTALKNDGTLISGTATGGGGQQYTATFTVPFNSESPAYVSYNGVVYNKSNVSFDDTFTFTPGDTLYIATGIGRITGGTISVDGVVVADGQGGTATYTYTLPSHDIHIASFYGSSSQVEIVFPTLSIISNGEYNVSSYYYANVSTDARGAEDIIQRTISGAYKNSLVTQVGVYAFYSCSNLSTVSLPNATVVSTNAFSGCSNLNTAYLPHVSMLGTGAFRMCSNLSSLTISNCTSVPAYAFYTCTKLPAVSFSSTSYIGSYGFGSCSSLSYAYFSSCKYIGSYAFYGCIRLSSIRFPELTSIYSYAFQYCSSLTSVYFPKVSNLSQSAFFGCAYLTSAYFPSLKTGPVSAFASLSRLSDISFPELTTINQYMFMKTGVIVANFPKVTNAQLWAFSTCSSLTTVNMPLATTTGSNLFRSCYKLTNVSFPVLSYLGSFAFIYCSSLSTISLPALTTIGSGAFQYCYNLLSLYLLGSTVCTLDTSTTFTSSPIDGNTASTGGVYGSVFVPESLYDSYISATNWALISDRIVSLTDAQIEALNS